MIAVSYTHLNPSEIVAKEIETILEKNNMKSLKKDGVNRFFASDLSECFRIMAVSYTHLDVYKRQGYRNTFIYETWIWEERTEFICFMVMLVVMVMAATWAYKRTIREIPDVL